MPYIRIQGEEEYLDAVSWSVNNGLDIKDVGYYAAFNFGEIRFETVEDTVLFKLSHETCLLLED